MLKRFFLCAGAALLCAAPARALLVLEEGKSQIHVFGSIDATWDDNVFANANAIEDTYFSARIGADYDRAAGIYSVLLLGEVTFDQFSDLSAQNSTNPHFQASIARRKGRLTGKLQTDYLRRSLTDNAALQTTRTRLDSLTAELALRYPLNEHFSIHTRTGLERHNYPSATFHDRRIFSEQIDVLHAYTSKLDLSLGYRLRYTDIPDQTLPGGYDRLDQALILSASGKLLARLDGTLRAGWQLRDIKEAGSGSINAYYASASLLWTPRTWVSFSLQAIKDFTTISTGLTADSLTIDAETRLQTPRRVIVFFGAGLGTHTYLDRTSDTRDDDELHFRIGAEYPLTDEIKLTATYVWTTNDSSLAFANYTRQQFSLGAYARF